MRSAHKVKELNMSSYLKEDSIDKVAKQQNSMEFKPTNMMSYPQINFKVDSAFPIKILDGMIEIEEKMQGGFSLYNRGTNLTKSLISADRVKAYLAGQDSKKGPPRLPSAPKL